MDSSNLANLKLTENGKDEQPPLKQLKLGENGSKAETKRLDTQEKDGDDDGPKTPPKQQELSILKTPVKTGSTGRGGIFLQWRRRV
jgi:hypothetical protein